MDDKKSGPATRVEYHVVYTGEPDDRWEIHYGDRRTGQQEGWTQEMAVVRAKEMAREHGPSTVVVHDRTGDVQMQYPYDEIGSNDRSS